MPLSRHELGVQDSNLEVFASKARRVYRFPYRPLRALAECHPRLAGLTRSARSWTRGLVRSAGLEPANTRTSSVPVCQLRHERKRAATRGRTGPSAVRGRSRKPCAAAELPPVDSNHDQRSQSAPSCRLDERASSTRGGTRTRTRRSLRPSALPVSVTRAYAARDSNSVPRIKSPVHHQSCLQRLRASPEN